MRTSAFLIIMAALPAFAADEAMTVAQSTISPPSQSQLALLRDGRSIDSASLLHPGSLEGDGVCFKLRTYVMKREGVGDSTRLVKYYTCQRASKYGVKHADVVIPDKR
ncbi:MAG TPA: hypothetical protein VFA68_21780 [Terriglobales bacterium]|nr:hypothetical protein [Terriglobales bacterium]